MVHVDIKKVGRIPDGGGRRVHGRGSVQDLAARAAATRRRPGYAFLHTAVDGYSRLAYTEALDDDKAVTVIGFMFRVRAFFAAHGTTRSSGSSPTTTPATRRKTSALWNIHYNYHRPHSAAGDRPPASRLHTGVTNVTASYN